MDICRELKRRSARMIIMVLTIASLGTVAGPSSPATSATAEPAVVHRAAAPADPPLRISNCTGSASTGRRWVQLLYLRALDRCAEAAASEFGITRFDDPIARAAYARNVFRAREAGRDWTEQAYQEVLSRSSDAAGRTYWANRLRSGTRFDQVEAELSASPEFYAFAGGTNNDWVLAVYETLLSRDPNAMESLFWANQLNVGRSRLHTALRILQSRERRVLIVDVFGFGFVLHRSAGANDLGYWADQLRSIDQLDLMARFVASAEAVSKTNDPNF